MCASGGHLVADALLARLKKLKIVYERGETRSEAKGRQVLPIDRFLEGIAVRESNSQRHLRPSIIKAHRVYKANAWKSAARGEPHASEPLRSCLVKILRKWVSRTRAAPSRVVNVEKKNWRKDTNRAKHRASPLIARDDSVSANFGHAWRERERERVHLRALG